MKAEKVDSLQPGLMNAACRYFMLAQIDNLWKEQLQVMKFVQQAMSLRGYAQKDPLTEYKLEGFRLYKSMQDQIRRNVIYNAYKFEPTRTTNEQVQTPTGKGMDQVQGKTKIR